MSELRTFGGWRERRGFGVAGLSGTQTGGALLAPFDGRPLVLDVRATEDALLVFIHVHDS